MKIETYKDNHSGIVGRSNGSNSGNEFIRLMNQAKVEREKEETVVANKAREAGAKLFHTWDGWFRLENNDWQAGHAPYSVGSKAKFTAPGYLYARFGTPAVSDYICIWDNGLNGGPLLMWKVVEIENDMFGRESYIVEYNHKLGE